MSATTLEMATMLSDGRVRLAHDSDGEVYIADSVMGGAWRFNGQEFKHEGMGVVHGM